ncbi:hypothetical protein [Salinisphaera sp.]|uniref:hypothetical protein n=1 Tax=Salinisphaera sp. TaxID=1914330 RepID=UPI000C6BE4D1|nr:hypothetical protein [Salinisphaera sp.]MAS09934.1 hypothetical protein [Salinisphaera sp.]|tara:strand:- start:6866 stop:7069 length:204 start_codon:yes stop_codon:yes gene_type:complete
MTAPAFPLDHLPLPRFCELTGRSSSRIRAMIAHGELAEGVEYCYDPKGKIQVILEGWNAWVWSGMKK